MKTAGSIRHLFMAVLALAVASQTVVVAQQDFEAAVDWIYYQDAAGREISYDFSSATIVGSRTITIPSGAVTVPASESGTTFTWERADGISDIWLDNNWFHLSIPQALPSVVKIPTADITVDGAIGDWAAVDTHTDDLAGDVSPSYPTGCDIDYVKLAYSSDGTTMYILYVLTENANPNVWYRLFLDNDLNGEMDEPGNYQVDVSNFGSWQVVSQSWDSEGNWYDVPENGQVAVSGQYIEVAVDCSAFGLPANVNAFGRTMQVLAPYQTYDQFSPNFGESEGAVYLDADTTVAAAPGEWMSAARISKFSNPGFGDSVPYLNYAGAILTGTTSDALQPAIDALWVTGDFMGNEMDDALLIMARVEGFDDVNNLDYYWMWAPENGGSVIIPGLDPSTTVVDLSLEVTNAGQTVSFYYRINSDSDDDWTLATTHTLPAGLGAMLGFPIGGGVTVALDNGFMRSAPVYRFWSDVHSRHFYTTNRAEKNKLIQKYSHVWTYEQIAYYTLAEDGEPNVLPVHRFWSDKLTAHFYTINEAERDKLINVYNYTWTYEGPAFYAWPEGSEPSGTDPVYRFWSDKLGCHFYTMSEVERDKLINTYSHVWTYEGIAWYAYKEQQE